MLDRFRGQPTEWQAEIVRRRESSWKRSEILSIACAIFSERGMSVWWNDPCSLLGGLSPRSAVTQGRGDDVLDFLWKMVEVQTD